MRGSLVRKMFEDYASGMYSMSELRDLITEEGLRSKKGCKIAKSQIEKILQNPFYYGYMKYNGLLYKHVHPVLISKELFDECEQVRKGRRRTRFKRTEKPFVLKGLLKCQHCGCSYSPEIKKGKYVYMRPTKSQGDCSYCYHLSEKKILSQIKEVLKGIKVSDTILADLNDELRKSSDKEHKSQIEEGKKLLSQQQTLQTRGKRARELYLDANISKEEYDEMMTEVQAERHNVEVRLQRLNSADDHFNKSLSTIFALAAKAHDLFKSSELEEKRRIIVILFPNLEIDAGKLVFKPREPFDVFFNLPHRLKWLPLNKHITN